jgi:hypothetical protein
MSRTKEPSMLPRRRAKDLLVRRLSDETLVYDLQRDKAHCLNPTAAAVWRHCDGHTSVSQLAAILRRECQIAADVDVVWLTLRQLQKARLLQESLQPPSARQRPSRRELIRRLGAAATIPVVMTILAPTASAQASNTCVGQVPTPGNNDCKLLQCPIGQKCQAKPITTICQCT